MDILQNSNTSQISLRLLKFSEATNAPTDKIFSWKHTTGGLELILYTQPSGFVARNPPRVSLLKVLQQENVLEKAKLEELIQEGKKAVAAANAHGIALNSDQLPINAIARSPNLAVRYRASPKRMRRFQLKFASAEDFEIALDYFRQIECPIDTPPPQKKSNVAPSCPPASLNIVRMPAGPESQSQTSHVQPPLPAQPKPQLGSQTTYAEAESSLRPANAPMLDLIDAVAVPTIPPRRDLPFKRLSAPRPQSCSDHSSPERPSHMLNFPSLPVPTYLGAQSPYPARVAPPAAMSPERPTSSTVRPSSSVSLEQTGACDIRFEIPYTYIAPRVALSETPLLGSSAVYQPSRPPTTLPALPQLPEQQINAAANHDFDHPIRRVTALLPTTDEARTAEAENLTRYAAQTASQRQAALSTAFRDHLQDDNFLLLCEDVERCWVRGLLGL